MDNLEELIEIFAKTADKKQMRKLFEEILTKSELKDVEKRWYLLKELYKGVPQRKIAKDMEISLCKITRGSRVLKQDDSELKKHLQEMFDD